MFRVVKYHMYAKEHVGIISLYVWIKFLDAHNLRQYFPHLPQRFTDFDKSCIREWTWKTERDLGVIWTTIKTVCLSVWYFQGHVISVSCLWINKMATARDPGDLLRSNDGKANFQRLTRLLITGGTALLRELFDMFCPPNDLPKWLQNPAIMNQLKIARLTKPQRDCLYPSPGVYGKSVEFDVTLLFRLLRTLCGLIEPATGWDALPVTSDYS